MAVALARASVIEAGLGRIAGRRGEALLAVMMLGSWMPLGLVGPYDPADPGGETERLESSSCSWIGDGIEAGMIGEWPPVEEPEETEVVRLRRLLP